MNPAALKTNVGDLKPGGLIIADERRVRRAQPRQGRLRGQSARRRHARQMAGDPPQHVAAHPRRGEAVRPRQQGSPALQEHVDAGAGALDVRPRPPADRRLAAGQVRQGARARRGQYRRAERRPCLWRDRRDGRPGRSSINIARRPGRARPLPHRHRRRGDLARPGRGRAARRPADVLRRLSDHARPAAILHHLSRLKEYGVTTFQAEDEIAAISAAIGASFAGSLGVTSSSGPRHRAEDRGDGPGDHDRAAFGHRQSASAAGLRPACRPRPSNRTSTRRSMAATPIRRCR